MLILSVVHFFFVGCRVGGKERGGARSRQRRLPWGGDMDQVQHVATISRADYEAGLAEEL